MYNVKLDKKVQKFLEKHKWESLIGDFEKAVIILSSDPFDNDLDLKPVKWLSNNFRLRIWKYRFLYKIKNLELEIYFYKWWSRGGVYK